MMNDLTKRQTMILHLLADGMTNLEIARVLDISPLVTRGLITGVLDKCGLTGRQQVAAYLERQRAS